MENDFRQRLNVVLSRIVSKLDILEADSIPSSARSIVDEIRQLTKQCDDILGMSNGTTVVTTASLNHLSSVEFETMMNEIDPIQTKNPNATMIEKILDNGVATATRIASNPAQSKNSEEKSQDTESESKTETEHKSDLKQEKEKEKEEKAEEEDEEYNELFKMYENVDLKEKFSQVIDRQVNIEETARKSLMAACIQDKPFKIVEILQDLWQFNETKKEKERENFNKRQNENNDSKEEFDENSSFVDWNKIFGVDETSWNSQYYSMKSHYDARLDIFQMVNYSPILTSMRLRRIECLKIMFDVKYNHKKLILSSGPSYSYNERNCYIYLTNGDCRIIEIVGEYLIRLTFEENRQKFRFLNQFKSFYLFSRFTKDDKKSAIKLYKHGANTSSMNYHGSELVFNKQIDEIDHTDWIKDYNSNKENNIIKYNFLLLKYSFLLSYLKTNNDEYNKDKALTIDDKEKFEQLFEGDGETMDPLLWFIRHSLPRSRLEGCYQIFNILCNIVLSKKYNKNIYQPLCNSIGIGITNGIYSGHDRIITNFDDLNTIETTASNDTKRNLLRMIIFFDEAYRVDSLKQILEKTIIKLKSSKDIIDHDHDHDSDKKLLLDCNSRYVGYDRKLKERRENETILLGMIDRALLKAYPEFDSLKQLESMISYNGIVYDFDMKQLVNVKSRTIIANSDKYSSNIKIDTPLILLLNKNSTEAAIPGYVKLILKYKPDISIEYSTVDLCFANLHTSSYLTGHREYTRYNNKKYSIIEQIFHIFATEDSDISREILEMAMDYSDNIARDLFEYVSPVTDTNIFMNVLNETRDNENPTLILKHIFKTLFFKLDGNGNKNTNGRKIWQLLDLKMSQNKDTSAMDNLQWRSKDVFVYVEQVYNASKNGDLTKLAALLDVVVANQQRAIEQFEKFTQQNVFANLFIQKFGMFFWYVVLACGGDAFFGVKVK